MFKTRLRTCLKEILSKINLGSDRKAQLPQFGMHKKIRKVLCLPQYRFDNKKEKENLKEELREI